MTAVTAPRDDAGDPVRTLAGGPAAQLAGVELVEARPGYAHARMLVTPSLLNAYGLCHGGFVFLLADTAFGAAANAYGSISLAAHAEIVYTSPAPPGVTLEAHATELVRYGDGNRNAIYDVQVTGGTGEVFAQFRGTIKVLRSPAGPTSS